VSGDVMTWILFANVALSALALLVLALLFNQKRRWNGAFA